MDNNSLVLSTNLIKDKIFTIRDTQVMLDKDLAELYRVQTKVFNQAVKRNIARFPEDFRFQLTKEEYENLRSQFVTLSSNSTWGTHVKYLPYVFTEQGVSMLSAVLKSDIAVEISIKIVREFVHTRKFISQNSVLFHRMDFLEHKQLTTDRVINEILDRLEDKTLQKKQGVFFNGQIFDAYIFVSDLIKQAQRSIILMDNYIDETTLLHLSSKADAKVKITILTKSITKAIKLDIAKNNAQYTNIEIELFKESHDRFLIIDETVYHLGASLKELGKKWFAFSVLDKSSFVFINKVKSIIFRGSK